MAVEATSNVSTQQVSAPAVVSSPAAASEKTPPVNPKAETAVSVGAGVAQATPKADQAKKLYVMA